MHLLENMIEHDERKVGQGHLSDLYRDAESHRLRLRARAGERTAGLGLTRLSAGVAARLRATGTLLHRRFVSPCGQFTLWHAQYDC